MRRLFEYESFHVVQTMYPYSYCFWVTGFKEKTPKRRYPGKRSDNTVNDGHGAIESENSPVTRSPSALKGHGCPFSFGD